MVAVEPGEVRGVAEAEVALTIGSTPTPACPTCSRALSKNTSTRCMSGRLTWQGRDTGTDPTPNNIPTPTRIHTHTRTNTGSHQPP